jgi:hypothetical protein
VVCPRLGHEDQERPIRAAPTKKNWPGVRKIAVANGVRTGTVQRIATK